MEAYGGTGWHCETAGELRTILEKCRETRQGVHLIEIPVGISEAEQSREIRLLNLYIKAKSGDPDSIKAWEQVK